MASLSRAEILSLGTPFFLVAAFAFSNASTVLARAVLTSQKPSSFRLSSEGAADPFKLWGWRLNLMYLLCS
jgi:hypothetical protein